MFGLYFNTERHNRQQGDVIRVEDPAVQPAAVSLSKKTHIPQPDPRAADMLLPPVWKRDFFPLRGVKSIKKTITLKTISV